MELRDARRAMLFSRARPVATCAQCGARLHVPEWSEYLDDTRVRHLWQCDACDYAFETTVRFPATAA